MKKCLLVVMALSLLIPSLGLAIDLDKLKIGGQVRVRGYDHDNFFRFDDDFKADQWQAFRFKTSIYVSADVSDSVTGYIRITNQTWGEGVTYQTSLNPLTDRWEEDNKSNKVFVDSAYIDIKNMKGSPFSLRLGRQNLIYGSGFVILDGQSQFASTSIYFDGIKLGWQITDKTLLDAFYMKDQENNRSNTTNDDINLIGLYLTSKGQFFRGKQELYGLYKEDELLNKKINIFGIRLSDKLGNGLDYSAEATIQNGDWTDAIDHKAWGTKLDLGYTFKGASMKPRIFARYVYLSGDDNPSDGDNENWDVVYGGWPQFGDLLAWKFLHVPGASNLFSPANAPLTSTTAEAAYHNLVIGEIGVGANLFNVLNTKISYSNLKFAESGPTGDDEFGHYYQLKMKYTYNKALSYSLYAAMIDPGNGFDKDDAAHEIFWEADLKF